MRFISRPSAPVMGIVVVSLIAATVVISDKPGESAERPPTSVINYEVDLIGRIDAKPWNIRSAGSDEALLVDLLYDGLTARQEGLTAAPAIAESWTADGNTTTFQLSQTRRDTSGALFTGESVVASLQRSLANTGWPLQRSVAAHVVEVTAPNTSSIAITTDGQIGDLAALLSAPELSIASDSTNIVATSMVSTVEVAGSTVVLRNESLDHQLTVRLFDSETKMEAHDSELTSNHQPPLLLFGAVNASSASLSDIGARQAVLSLLEAPTGPGWTPTSSWHDETTSEPWCAACGLSLDHLSSIGQPLHVLVPPGSRTTRLGQQLVAALGAHGVSADIVGTSQQGAVDAIERGGFDIAVFGVTVDWKAPFQTIMSVFSSSGSSNIAGFRFPELDEQLKQLTAASGTDKLAQLFDGFDRYVEQNGLARPLAVSNVAVAGPPGIDARVVYDYLSSVVGPQ